MNKKVFPPQYQQITALLQTYQPYLVGGAVRDMLLDIPVHDLDFALPEGTISAGRLIADELRGDFFVLDEERSTTRIILGGRGQPRLVVDLTVFQGATIEEDLASRDFTITSMALNASSEPRLIDPFQGERDLQQGWIRATSDHALADDPLRCLRAVRLAAQLQFKILPATIAQIRRSHPALASISPERIRDELFRILEGPHQTGALLSLRKLDLYGYILPGELSDPDSRTVRQLELIWSLFLKAHDQDLAGNWHWGLLIHWLGRYRDQIRAYLAHEPVPGRSVYQLSLLMALLMAGSGQITANSFKEQIGEMPLANIELDILAKGIKAALDFQEWSSQDGKPQPLQVYRYFHSWGTAGLAGIFLGLACTYQMIDHEKQTWNDRLEAARKLLEGYWERQKQWVDPEPLLNGNDIRRRFNIPAGPRIGELLEKLKEEQVISGLNSPEEALAFLEGILGPGDTPEK